MQPLEKNNQKLKSLLFKSAVEGLGLKLRASSRDEYSTLTITNYWRRRRGGRRSEQEGGGGRRREEVFFCAGEVLDFFGLNHF